jgi:hypothetical protein
VKANNFSTIERFIPMPKFKKLNAEELAKARPAEDGERARIREEYKTYIKGLRVDEGGELTLEEDEKKITIKNRIKRAAEDLDVMITFKRSGDNTVRFQVKER